MRDNERTTANITDLIVQNRQLNDEVQRRADQLTLVNRVAAAASQSLNVQNTLDLALAAVCEATNAQAGGISLIDESAEEIVLHAQRGWLRDFVRERPLRVPLGKGISGWVIGHDEVYISNSIDEKTQFAVPSFSDEQFKSMAMAPMHARGKIIGILSIMSLNEDSFDRAAIDVLRNVADSVGIAIDNARLYEIAMENQHQLGAVLHSTADGIVATDQVGRITLVNAAAQTMLSAPASRLIGLPLRDAPIPPHMRESLRFALGRTDDQTPMNRSFRVTTDNGRVLSVIVSPILVERQLETSEADGWVIVLQDITHLRDAEVARSQFIKTAAHDMRNPLGAALNSMELLRRVVSSPQTTAIDIEEIIEIAHTSVRRVQALIDDLQQLESIQAGVNFSLSEVDIGELVQEVSADIYPRLREKKLHYRVDLETRIPPLLADRRQLLRALLNYLDNAIRYAPMGGEVRLKAFLVPPDQPGGDAMLHIEVTDSGPGIPVEAQARLFERFYRADSASTGTGLGLAIVRSVAEVHGGRVYLDSSTGQGSVFGFTMRAASAT